MYQGGAVNAVGDGAAHLGAGKQIPLGVEAQILHDGGGAVPELVVAVVDRGTHGIGIGTGERHGTPFKDLPHRLRICGSSQRDGLTAKTAVRTPPELIWLKHTGTGDEHILACSDGNVISGRTGLDDGHIQQQRQRAIGGGERDDHRGFIWRRNTCHIAQTAAIVAAGAGGLERSDHIGGRERRTVGKGYAAAQRDGIGPLVV